MIVMEEPSAVSHQSSARTKVKTKGVGTVGQRREIRFWLETGFSWWLTA